jgi:hypothetical protein
MLDPLSERYSLQCDRVNGFEHSRSSPHSAKAIGVKRRHAIIYETI